MPTRTRATRDVTNTHSARGARRASKGKGASKTKGRGAREADGADGGGAQTVVLDGAVLTTTPVFDTFWRYTAERQAVEEKRRAGLPPPWTDDPILLSNRFCAVFRVADTGSQFLIHEVIESGAQEPAELAFRVILYNFFCKPETYTLLASELGTLTWVGYDRAAYVRVLSDAVARGETLYTGSFQKPAPALGHKEAFLNHLTLLEVMMAGDIAGELAACAYMADAYAALRALPGMGDFLAFQLLLDLSYTPLLPFHASDFVVPGGGAARGLRACFAPRTAVAGREVALMRWMEETQGEQFARRGLAFNGLGAEKAPMTLVDVEHTLCEVYKYTRLAARSGAGQTKGRRFVADAPLPAAVRLPQAWAHPARSVRRVKPGKDLPVARRYVVRELLAHRVEGGRVEYLVDWMGYGVKDRTWEPAGALEEDVPEMVVEYHRVRKEGKKGGKGKGKARAMRGKARS